MDPAATPALALARELIARPSLTPDDAGCQDVIAARLVPLGFQCETLRSNGVTNLWARLGDARPLTCFAGHTDVVPTGPLDAWATDPFVPTVRDGYLYGSGAADMKGSLSAFVFAIEAFFATGRRAGSIALLITSLEGWFLTPMLLSRAANMNQVAVFVGLIFWSWIWGVWGLLLAVPMLMVVKSVCDHIEDLQPVGQFLGE